MSHPELPKLLSRLAHRLPWETWDLSEEEYNMLDEASGEEIVTIAYRNSFNVLKIIENADMLIIEHNDRNQRKLLREVKNLKMCLMGIEPKKKKVDAAPPLPVNSEEVERRLLNETIEEVVGLTLNNPAPREHKAVAGGSTDYFNAVSLPNNERDGGLQHQNITKTRIKATPSFVDKIQSAVSAAATSTPSLNRDSSEAVNAAHINLEEFQPTDINSIGPMDQLPEATNETLADLGMYATSIGRQLFNKINNISTPQLRDQVPDILVSGEQSNVPEEVLLGTYEDANMIPAIELPLVDDSRTPRAATSRATRSLRAASVELPSTADKTRSPRASSVAVFARTPDAQITSAPDLDTSAIVQSPSISAQNQREDAFEKIAAEAVAQKLQKPKRRRRRPKPQQRSLTPEPDAVVERNKPLIRHKRKPLVSHDFVLHLPLRFMTDPEDYTDYMPDAPEEEGENVVPNDNLVPLSDILGFDEAPPAPKTSLLPPTRQTQTPLVSPTRDATTEMLPPRQTLSTTARTSTTPANEASEIQDIELSPQKVDTRTSFKPKRARLEDAAAYKDQYQTLDLDDIGLVPPPPIVTSKDQRVPPLPKRQTIDTSAMEFASWHNRSQQNFAESSKINENKENEVRRPRQRGNDDEYDENGNQLFRRVQGKYDTMIEFVGADGKVKSCSNYSMETLGLYLQIRFIMAEHNRWTMSYAELRPKVSLLDSKASDGNVAMRFMLLADFKFLKLTLTKDENDIIDVEIPVEMPMEVQDALAI